MVADWLYTKPILEQRFTVNDACNLKFFQRLRFSHHMAIISIHGNIRAMCNMARH